MGLTKAKHKQVIELLQSGNFTIQYNDNCQCTLLKGKKKEYLSEIKTSHISLEIDMDNNENGYVPFIVDLLTEALGGKTTTI